MQDDRQDHYFGQFFPISIPSAPAPRSSFSHASLPGLSLREMIHEFRHQTLVLFKCLLLQRKVRIFFSALFPLHRPYSRRAGRCYSSALNASGCA